jgi:membrane protein DedA with SNARE-associated domain/rhodanese-related sulfurtransferase
MFAVMTGAVGLTYSGIGVAVFGQQFCLPVPSMVLLMTAGALAAEGQGHLRISLVLLSGVVGCLAADGFWFWLGRRWGSGVIRLVCSLTSDPRGSRERSRAVFARWGLKLLLVAKFVPGLDGVSPPLAGAEGATVTGFVLYDAAGSVLWCAAYVGLGYLFSRQVDAVAGLIDHFGHLVLLAVCVPLVGFVVWRGLDLVRMIRHLRLRRISPAMLARKLGENPKVVVFDLLDFEARDGEIAGIPGALRVDPKRMRTARRLKIPDGVEIVLYCSSKNEFASARVAEALEKRGFTAVWVLEGGLEGWVEDGHAVTHTLSTPTQIADRMGIVLPPEMQ